MHGKFKLIMVMVALLLFCGTVSAVSAAHVYNVTDNSYNKYFSNSGYINNTNVKSGDTMYLSGTIKNKNMYIDRPLNITGSKTTQMLNGTITILSQGSGTTISNINIKNSAQKGIILSESDNNTVERNNITVNDPNESYAIYLYSSNNNKITANNLITTGKDMTIGILVWASDNNQITSNKVTTTGTNVALPYKDSRTINGVSVKEIFPTYGILLLYSSKNDLSGNNVFLKSGLSKPMTPSETCMNSMVGIDMYYDCDNNLVTSNYIQVRGNNPYSYGLGVLGSTWGGNSISEGNVFAQNKIDVVGSYFATGFIAGLQSINTTLSNNIIDVSADVFGYGVTLESSQKSNIIKNLITTTANVNYAVELYSSNENHIEENKIYPSGNYTLGIGTYGSGNNTINNNTIRTNGTGSTAQIPDSLAHQDSIPIGNEGILLYLNSNQNTIENNSISSSAKYAVNTTTSSNNTVTNNYLVSNNNGKMGNSAVSHASSDTVKDNTPVGVTYTPPAGYYNKTITITLKPNITGATIYYTTNGSTPTSKSTKYTTPLNITKTTTLKFISINTSGVSSPVISKTYTLDKIKPVIKSTDPKNGAVNVWIGKTIKVTFNENIQKSSKFWIELKNSAGKAITFTAFTNGKTLTIKPKSKLAESKYTLTLHTGAVTDLAGNPVTLKNISFTAGTPPTIKTTDPKNRAVNVWIGKTIKVTFSENIRSGSKWIELVANNGSKIAIKNSIKGKVLTITHTAKLKANTKYRLAIHTGAVTDAAGNTIASKTTSFITGKT